MLKLMTFNIRNGDADDGENAWLYRHELVALTIEQERPDVLGLQEVFDYQLDFLLDRLPQYAYAGVGRDDGDRAGEFSPILYNREMVALDEDTFWLSHSPLMPGSRSWGSACTRICTCVKLSTIADGEIMVYNCHLDHVSAEARRNGLKIVADRAVASGLPFVIMGDFNCGEEELASYRVLSMHIVNSYRIIHPGEAEPCTFHEFDARVKGPKIDHILVGPRVKFGIRGAEVLQPNFDGRLPSDHNPVTATIVVLCN